MDILNIIEKKKNGQELSKKEIQFFVDGVCSGLIKDYQTTSLLMAVCLKGMTFDETFNLTMSMARSGKTLDLSSLGNCVDKHSTGGVSDTTTLIVVPVLASVGVKVAKMSGRSLGFTGGTADKMEVFNGYNTEISTDEFISLIKQNNASIISQSADFALADKIIYSLRSNSGTVENLSLIASSIMSKKIACGAKTIVLDCKYGSGAFMKTKKDSIKLAKLMVKIGKKAGLNVCAVISSMEQPLSNFVGNNFEVYSSLQVLDGTKNDLYEVSKKLCSLALIKSGACNSLTEAQQLFDNSISTKSAKEKLKQIVQSQGGSTQVFENPNILLKANKKADVFADKTGYVNFIDTSKIGIAGHNLQKINGVLKRQDDTGIILSVKLGSFVKIGDKLATIYYNDVDNLNEIKSDLSSCFNIGKKTKLPKLIDCVIE